jgi:hypothetical protein
MGKGPVRLMYLRPKWLSTLAVPMRSRLFENDRLVLFGCCLRHIQLLGSARFALYVSNRGLRAHSPLALQYVAGHDNIKTKMRYVHPREAAVHKLFARLADLEQPEERIACKRSVQNPV